MKTINNKKEIISILENSNPIFDGFVDSCLDLEIYSVEEIKKSKCLFSIDIKKSGHFSLYNRTATFYLVAKGLLQNYNE